MRNLIFWLLAVIEWMTIKRIVVFILFLTIGLLLVGLFSCVTVDKSLTKIASTSSFTPAQEKLLATVCATKFPPVEYISEGTKTVDSTAYKEAYRALENALKDAGSDVQNLVNLVEQKGQDNEVLRDMLFAAKKKEDSLKAVKQAYKFIPCPESHTRDTAYQNLTAQVRAMQLTIDEERLKSAEKDRAIEKEKADHQITKEKLQEAQKERWNLFWIGIGVGAGVVIGLTVILKLKSIL